MNTLPNIKNPGIAVYANLWLIMNKKYISRLT
jgi:hypothetical protein